ncbi:hypothetical protein BC834DRAFT_866051 [Gloeopeniophorella convolvens]|nr:hypothetical protein BC834DRAFT_866051 [Gloeopeniophorella convolvens]
MPVRRRGTVPGAPRPPLPPRRRADPGPSPSPHPPPQALPPRRSRQPSRRQRRHARQPEQQIRLRSMLTRHPRSSLSQAPQPYHHDARELHHRWRTGRWRYMSWARHLARAGPPRRSSHLLSSAPQRRCHGRAQPCRGQCVSPRLVGARRRPGRACLQRLSRHVRRAHHRW